jgi:hypothetical protein
LEELLRDKKAFEEYGVADATDVVMKCTCCGDETMLGMGDQIGNNSCTVPLQSHGGLVAEEREEVLTLPSRACVNSEEKSVDLKRWRELMDTGISIDYRCIRYCACNDCRNADQTEKVILRQDDEDDMIKKSVTLDYSKQEILGTLPLRGKEEKFLSPNMDRAVCMLNQQCWKLKGISSS